MTKGIICGTGRAGTYLHYGALRAAGAEVLAFVDINEKAAKKAADLYSVPRYYGSIEDALEKEKHVDFVDICTSSSTHLPIARAALECGCNILIEKPITENLAELEELRSLKLKYGKTVCAVHNHKFYPGMVKLRNMVSNGELGDIISVHREMSFNYEAVRMMDPDHWAHNISGGRLFEANPHNLYLLHSFLGEMSLIDIYPRKISNRWEHAQIDEFLAVLRTETATVNIKMSMHCTKRGYGGHAPNFFIVMGTKKTVYANYNYVIELGAISKILKSALTEKVDSYIHFRKDSAKLFDSNGNIINIGAGSGHRWLIERFVGYLDGRYDEEAVQFEEACYVQKMNLIMGKKIEENLSRG